MPRIPLTSTRSTASSTVGQKFFSIAVGAATSFEMRRLDKVLALAAKVDDRLRTLLNVKH